MIFVIGHFYICSQLCKARIHRLNHEEIAGQFCIIPCLFIHNPVNFDFRACWFDIQFVFGIYFLSKYIDIQKVK